MVNSKEENANIWGGIVAILGIIALCWGCYSLIAGSSESEPKSKVEARTKTCPKCRGTGKAFLGEPCTVCYGRLKVTVTSDEIATEKWHQENFDRVARGEKPLKYFQWWIREHWLKVLFIGSLIALGTWAQATRDKSNSGSQPPSDSRSDQADRECIEKENK